MCEWCQDGYGSYSSSSQTDPTGPISANFRVLRGGGYGLGYWSVTTRGNFPPSAKGYDIGFRLSLDFDPRLDNIKLLSHQ